MLKQKIADLIVASVEVGTDEQREKLRGFATAAVNLATAADNYSDQSEANDGDDDAEAHVAGALVDLSGIVDLGSTEKANRLKSVIADVYSNPDPLLEQRGEELFGASVDFRLAATTLADLFLAPEPQ